MKDRFAPHPAVLCLLFVSMSGIAHGQTRQYWNVSGTGGDAIWGTGPGDKNWNLVPGALAANTAWQDPTTDVAVFQDAIGGIVTVFDTVKTAGIIQNGANYTLNAGTIVLVPDSSANAPFVDVQSGILMIDSPLAGSAGLVKTGGGTLLLTTSNPYTGPTAIQSGTLNLAGSLASTHLSISSGATLRNQNGALSASAILTNTGSLTLDVDDTIASYISNGGTLATGPGKLFSTSAALNDGSILAGQLNTTTLTSNGAVLISGTATAGSALIASGILTLSRRLASDAVGIASGASLLNQNGGLLASTILTNTGSLTLDVDDTIASYISNGGTLAAGLGTLSTTDAKLNDGSTLAGQINTGLLINTGEVLVSGKISAARINVQTGILTNTGTLGNGSTFLNINQGATLAANGIQRYSLLTTSGADAGTWRGDLHHTSIIAPGVVGETGVLAIRGNYSQSQGATLLLDISAKASDRLDITGDARFKGSLVLNQLGTKALTPFVPVTVVSASGYAGNITSFSENLNGAVLFNPGNGTVTRIDPPSGGNSFFGATRNQTSTWISLYDDVIDPGIANITSGPDGYDISSGLADTGNPDLQWALAASFAPGGLNPALLNRLSPEVYGGLSDYAMQATRAHQRSALSAPALDPADASRGRLESSAQSSAKGGIAHAATPLNWEFFAASDYFQAGTDNSRNQADFDFEGMGLLTGARTRLLDPMQIGVYFGADSGTLSGELINADAFGWNFGAIGEYLLEEKSRTRLTAGISYGRYLFDGTRGSASATAAGWAPGNVDYDDVDVEAFDVFVGVDGVAWKQEALTFIPSAGLRYSMSKMDTFSESTSSTQGSPIALNISNDRHESLLLELGVKAQVTVNAKVSLWGEGGFNIGLHGDGRVLTASFAQGNRAMSAEADGLGDDSIYLGWGTIYQFTENIQASFAYRADIRPDVDAQQELRISSSWRF